MGQARGHINKGKCKGTVKSVEDSGYDITPTKKAIYHSLFTSRNTYLIQIWGDTTKRNINQIQVQQNKTLKILYNMKKRTATEEVYGFTNELDMKRLITLNNLIFIHKMRHNKIQTNIRLALNQEFHTYQTRAHSHIRTHKSIGKRYAQAALSEAIRTYNTLPDSTKRLGISSFKLKAKHILSTTTP